MTDLRRPQRQRPNPIRPLGGGYEAFQVPDLYCGLDLGQANDFTALAIAQRVMPQLAAGHPDDWGSMLIPHYQVRALDRVPLNTPYPTIARTVATMFRRPPFSSTGTLVVDATGVGRPVVDSLRQAGLAPVAVTITGGSEVSGHRRAYRVPKNDLISNLILLFQQRRIRIAASLHHAETLLRELEAMRMRITASGNDQYGAYGEGEHDDLVLALALALWLAERLDGRERKRNQPGPRTDLSTMVNRV
jgi:hypothetical protein